ncbi:MAG TPA: hypothetical protein VGF58_00175 [Burkholderiales bacterium]|jgi:hypothetical protein
MDGIERLTRKVRRKVVYHGVRNAVWLALLKGLGCDRWICVLHGHFIDEVDPAFTELAEGYAGSFIGERALEAFICDPEMALSAEFVRYALGKGDKCFGFVRDGALRAYGWYATTPTRVSPELKIHFARGYVYMYHGVTHASHRGRRLFPAGMARALRHFRAIGYKGMLLYVDATNLDSLKSCARMGWRVFGTLYVVRLFGRNLVYRSPGCSRYGFGLEDVSAARPAVRAATTKPST